MKGNFTQLCIHNNSLPTEFDPENFFVSSHLATNPQKRLFSDVASSISSRCNDSNFEETLKRPKLDQN